MTEEQVTKAILSWLIRRNWHIVSFDFPQSGTGRVLHSNNSDGEKNKGSIIPDIIAIKDQVCVFLENKDRYHFPDYQKVNNLIVDNQYTNSISALLYGYEIKNIYYGIGLPTTKHKDNSKGTADLTDFILGVETDKTIKVLHNPKEITF